MNETASFAPLGRSLMYQMFLRAMTAEGTFAAAERLLPNIRSLGFDIVYLCPISEADDDETREFWSDRQKAAKTDNPKNPYRIKDYFALDPEYGTEADFESFVRTAHSLGMRVMVDIVYFHCGPTAVFIKEHPEFVQRAEDGSILNGQWHFPRLNFTDPGLREYLYQNMEYFVKRFDVDGYRADVAAGCPLDFWREGIARVRKLKPDAILLAEGENPDYLTDAFDLNYEFGWGRLLEKAIQTGDARCLRERWEQTNAKNPRPGAVVRFFDQHDFANESYDVRFQAKYGSPAVEAALAVSNFADGVPFIYNGYEVCDRMRHSIFANRFHGRMSIDWSGALTAEGKSRAAFLRRLADLRRSQPAISEGELKWLDTDQPSVAVFERVCAGQRLISAVSFSDKPMVTVLPEVGEPSRELLCRGMTRREGNGLRLSLEPYGMALVEMKL